MERGSRRLLHDLAAVGRSLEDRPSAWERLELEVGPLLAQKLIPADEGRPSSAGSAGRGKRVA